MIRLKIMDGPNAGADYPIDHGDIIGTTDTAKIRIDGRDVLPRHLMVNLPGVRS